MVTNPATRDWTWHESLFATLNEMFGNRTICGIGRGDSTVRVTNGKPTSLATLPRRDHREPRPRERRRGRVPRQPAALPVEPGQPPRCAGSRRTDPEALALTGEVGDGFILQLADPDIVAWSVGAVTRLRPPRAGSGGGEDLRGHAAYVGDDTAHQRDRAAGSAAWWATTWPTSSRATARAARACPRRSPPTSRAATATTTTSTGGPGTCTPTSSPTTSSTASASSARPHQHIERLRELQDLGVDQYAIYLQHDAKEATLQAYGEHVIPAVGGPAIAKRCMPNDREDRRQARRQVVKQTLRPRR